MRLEIDGEGDRLVARELLGIKGGITDMRPVVPELLVVIRTAERKQFDSGGRYGSGGWTPLAAATVERKRREGLDQRILVARGRMMAALIGETSDSLAIPRTDGLDYGATVPYLRYHQDGTDRMPQRRPAQLPDRDRQELVRVVQRGILAGRGLL